MTTELKTLIQWVESQPRFKPKTDLKRMKQAIDMWHINLDSVYMIHVAGTNGKGSVTQFLTQIFLANNKSVGTYTSPYIQTFNERININGKPLDDESLCLLLKKVKLFNERFQQSFGEPLSFFELLTLAALACFHENDVDIAIIEVGIGGLLDATNAYKHYDLSLITNIGFDHMAQLGNTLESIAYNKLGILRNNGILVSTIESSLHAYIKSYIEPLDVKAYLLEPTFNIVSHYPLIFEYKNQTYESGLSGFYQIKNAILAIEAARLTPFHINDDIIKKGLKNAYLPARLDMLKPNVIIDGAHNIHAFEALKKTMNDAFPNHRIHIVFSALGDKDISGMLGVIKSFTKNIDLVSFPDVRYTSLEAYKDDKIRYIKKDVFTHLDGLIKKMKKDEIIIITGSLHFVGYVLNHYK